MEDQYKVAQGADEEFTFQIKDPAGAAINLSTGIDRLFILFKYKDGTILEKFAKPSQAGWADVTGSGLNYTNGICRARLLTSKTTSAKPGKIYVEVRVKINDGNSTDDSQRDYILPEKYVCTIVESLTSTLTLP